MKDIFYNDAVKELNQATFSDYYHRLALLAQAVFKWEGLPEGINERHIERYLFNEGRCMFFEDSTKGLMVTRCTDSGLLNYYDEPTRLTPVATHYYNWKSLENHVSCVEILNNDYAIPTHRTIMQYAIRLTDIQRTIDVNIMAQKTPAFIRATKNQRLSLVNMYRQWKGNEPLVMVDDTLQNAPLEVLKTDAPVVFDKLHIEKNKLWNECMTFLGVNNANTDKRERLVDDEVQANNQQIELSAQVMLKARQRAAEEINSLFGTEIEVTMRTLCEPLESPTAAETYERVGGAE